MKGRAVLSFIGAIVLHASWAVAAEPLGHARSSRDHATPKPDGRMPASALHERNSHLNPEDLSERLKAAQAYVLESQDSPSKLTTALSHLDAVLQADPHNVEAHLLAAQIEIIRNKPLIAQAHYQAVIKADPSNRQAYLGLGDTYSRLGNETQASEAYGEYRRLTGLEPLPPTEAKSKDK